MKASVIVRSRNEADRLRLTLDSLSVQTERPQVVVVNDGSSDSTAEVISQASQELDLMAIHHTRALGLSAAANAGAARATGDIVIFLDGDTLAAPDLVAGHLLQHRQSPGLVLRGETWHLRCTRLFRDPQSGTPKAGEESRVARMTDDERVRSTVTRQQVRHDFSAIDLRAQPGVYPGFGPRRLYELEMDALINHPGCTVLWAAASGSNLSVSRTAFLESSGFRQDLLPIEQRELALRLCQRGHRMMAVPARSYHLIHRSGWRDPLREPDWERLFYEAHPLPEVALLSIFWASLSEPPPFPAQACIPSLLELAATAERYRGIVGLQNVRDSHLRVAAPHGC